MFTIFLKYANIYRKNRPNWKKIIKKTCFLTVFENCSILAQSQRTKPPNSIETIFTITFARNYEKKKIILGTLDTYLVDKSFVPATQRMILKIVRCYYWSSFFSLGWKWTRNIDIGGKRWHTTSTVAISFRQETSIYGGIFMHFLSSPCALRQAELLRTEIRGHLYITLESVYYRSIPFEAFTSLISCNFV